MNTSKLDSACAFQLRASRMQSITQDRITINQMASLYVKSVKGGGRGRIAGESGSSSLLEILAICRLQSSLSASDSMGVLRRCTASMSARPASSGKGTTTRLDRRPGLVRAGSSTCTHIQTLLQYLHHNDTWGSISVKASWLVFQLLPLPAHHNEPRHPTPFCSTSVQQGSRRYE